MIETRKGSDQTLKQHLWGLMYVDELLQIAINQDIDDNAEDTCERFFWICQDASYNVLGVLSISGDLIERYEYTPYGQRTVYSRGWFVCDVDDDGDVDGYDSSIVNDHRGDPDPASRYDVDGNGEVDFFDMAEIASYFGAAIADDPLVMHPRLGSYRHADVSAGPATYGLCDIGHQGLMHDKEFGLIHNRARYLHPRLGRFLQRDPLGYADGMSLYEYVQSAPTGYVDPWGNASWRDGDFGPATSDNDPYDCPGPGVRPGVMRNVHWPRMNRPRIRARMSNLMMSINERFGNTLYYKHTGFRKLLGKLNKIMHHRWLDESDFSFGDTNQWLAKPNEFVIMRETLRDQSYSTVFHEAVHMYNDWMGKYGGYRTHAGYELNEGVATTAGYLADRLQLWQDFERDMWKYSVTRTVIGPATDALLHWNVRRDWRNAWRITNRIVGSHAGSTTGCAGAHEFKIQSKHVRLVRDYLDIKFSCREFAKIYNATFGDCLCVEFLCDPAERRQTERTPVRPGRKLDPAFK